MNLNGKTKDREAADKHNGEKQTARNDLVRGFSLSRVSKWVSQLAKDNISKMNSNDLVDNLNAIRTVSVKVQAFVYIFNITWFNCQIHEICGKITESMKLYDLKLKEIKVLDKKIAEERGNLKHKPVKKLSKTKKLKQKLKVEKKMVHARVQKVVAQHDKLIVKFILIKLQKVVGVYNPKFAQKHKKDLHDLLTQITLQLKGHMKDKLFQQCYKQFMITVVKACQHLTPVQLKDPRKTAHELIAKYFLPELKKLHDKLAKKNLKSKYPPLPLKPTKLKHIK